MTKVWHENVTNLYNYEVMSRLRYTVIQEFMILQMWNDVPYWNCERKLVFIDFLADELVPRLIFWQNLNKTTFYIKWVSEQLTENVFCEVFQLFYFGLIIYWLK